MTAFENLDYDNPLVLIGCGHMGGALLRGWLAGGVAPEAVWVVDPEPKSDAITSLPWSHLVARADEVGAGPARVIVLAIKPQMMSEVLPGLPVLKGPGTVVLSIAAGTRIATIEAAMGAGSRVIRAIPNTPAALGFGISGLAFGGKATHEDQALAHALMGAVGAVVALENEILIDAVTALSGSGPAYVFYLAEALAVAGEELGLEGDVAMELARQTIIGAGRLLETSEESASELRQNVTSPKGTTQAALDVLMAEEALQKLMIEALRCAYDRAGELAREV